MTIIPTKLQLMPFFSDVFLEKTARRCGFMERLRNIGPQSLVLSLIAALSKGNCTSIADLHRQFNGMCLSEKHTVAYKPFHNQLRKSAFADFMKTLATFAMAQLIEKALPPLPKKFSQFDDILLQDGSSFNVHPELAGVFPCRFSPLKAAVECHMTLSLFSQSPIAMTVTADTASERAYLPAPRTLRNKLLLADAGYVDFGYFEQLSLSGESFIVRGSQSLNPLIVSARNGQGRQLPTLAGKKLREISRKNNRAEILDFTCRRGRFEFRVIRRWFAQEKRFCFWLTNLPPSHFTADDIMAVYRCRWQVELLFKELKSHTNWTGFATGQKAIAEGLIWASLLALIVWRGSFCLQFPFSRPPKMLMSGCCRYWARLFIMPGRK